MSLSLEQLGNEYDEQSKEIEQAIVRCHSRLRKAKQMKDANETVKAEQFLITLYTIHADLKKTSYLLQNYYDD